MIGTRLGAYRVVALLGAGGMGEVYRARDERLGRDVAIKVLPGPLADDPERLARFEREARALAALSHPNILAIFDFGKEAGISYAVTELLEGETLRQRLTRERPPWRKTVEIAAAIADGLAAAHGKGISHRDLKPDNLFLTADGRVKVLDFGLARVEKQAQAGEGLNTWSDPGTAAGTVLGTVGYMAPEQVRGQPGDARSDIFALGCVLYEMLAGKRAFARETATETMAAILKDPAPEVSVSGMEVTPELNRIVSHCLEKNPGERFQSASDLSFHLKSLLTGAAVARPPGGRTDESAKPETPSIAVLPFANLSPDPDQEYFCDGMTEEIIAALSKIRGLRVISRSSAMTLKGTRKTTLEISELLHVGNILEGSVRKSGNNLRIIAQLIDAATDTHLWTERFAGTLDDVFDIQEKVALAIAEALRIRLNPDERSELAERPVSDMRAHECYLLARHESLLATGESFMRALRLLQRGVDTLGDHAILYYGLAQLHWWSVEFDAEPREEGLRAASEYTRRVLALDARYAHALLAKLERATGSQLQAIRHFEDAVTANPSDVDSMFWLCGSYGFHAGRPAAAAIIADKLIRMDPIPVANHIMRVWACWAAGDFRQGLAVLQEMSRREPSLRFINLHRIHMLARLGRCDEACKAADETLEENSEDIFAVMVTAFRHALLGERVSLLAVLEGPGRSFLWNDPEAPEWAAGWLALVDEKEKALDWLDHWIDRGSINYPMLARGDPLLEGLRAEPRFQRLLDRIRPEWERFTPRFQSSD
jgi:serine/threonine protein kinase/tetratricopeptide (TPR) repeat protein